VGRETGHGKEESEASGRSVVEKAPRREICPAGVIGIDRPLIVGERAGSALLGTDFVRAGDAVAGGKVSCIGEARFSSRGTPGALVA
jgi:hypothetical protein